VFALLHLVNDITSKNSKVTSVHDQQTVIKGST